MDIGAISPWVSLLAAVLSISYLVVEYVRDRRGARADHERRRESAADGGSTATEAPAGDTGDPTGSALVGFLDAHGDTVIAVVVLLATAGVAHWYLRGTDFFYPVALWAVFGVSVVAVVGGDVSDATPDADS